MNNIYYVEDCLTITPKEVFDIANNTSTKKMRTDIDCWYEDESNIVSVSLNGKEPQGINIEWIEITPYKTASKAPIIIIIAAICIIFIINK